MKLIKVYVGNFQNPTQTQLTFCVKVCASGFVDQNKYDKLLLIGIHIQIINYFMQNIVCISDCL